MKPVDPRLLRHARSARGGVVALSLLGGLQAMATVEVLVGLALVVTGHPGLAWAVAAGFAARAGLTWAEQVVAARVSARVAAELRPALLEAALRRGPSWVADFGAGRLTALLTSGLDHLGPWFSSYLPALVLGATLPPLVLVALAVADPPSAIIALLTLPLVPLFGALIGRATAVRAQEQWQASSRLAGHFLDAVQGIATLRVFGRAERQVDVVASISERHRTATMRVLRVAFLSSTALDLVATLSVGLIAVEAGVRVAGGSLPLLPALVGILLAPEAYRPLRELGSRFHATAEAASVIAEVDLVLAPFTDRRAALVEGAPSVLATGVRGRFLDLPSLSVSAGEIVALAGVSGAGKTTALRTLAGLEPLTAGILEVGGPTPRYLSQRPSLAHARTVGDVTSSLSLVPELTLDTPLGERAQGISSGQRHRLALSALLPGEPAVVLLDEPTSHLDPAGEQLVLGALARLASSGCAVVVTSHRPAVLAAADRVVTLEPVPGSYASSGPVVVSDSAVEASRPGSVFVPVALGAGSWLAGLTLTGAAGWLIVQASTLPPILSLSAAVVLVRGSAVARPLLRYLERLSSHSLALSRLGRLRSSVYEALIPRTPGPGLRRRGDLLTRVVDDVDALVDASIRNPWPARLTLAVAAGAGVALLPGTVAVFGAALLLGVVVGPWVAARAQPADRTALNDALVESVSGLEDLTDLSAVTRNGRALAVVDARAALRAGLGSAFAALGVGVLVTGTAVVAASSSLTPAWAAAVLLATLALAEPFAALPDSAQAHHRAHRATTHLTTLTAASSFAAGTSTTSVPRSGGGGKKAEGAAGNGAGGNGAGAGGNGAGGAGGGTTYAASALGVEVRGVVAGWEGECLRGVSLSVPVGGRVAVTGVSGSGKSTLAAVLAGLLEPSAGEVVRGRTVLVGDETDHVFATTVRENLRLASPSASDEELSRVLARAQLGDWLEHLPDGLDTWLASGGTTMSGGERRRFAIARALLAGPELLVLDEPTEGLDVPTAEALMGEVLAPSLISMVLLTHRPEGLHLVDDVFQLEEGLLKAPHRDGWGRAGRGWPVGGLTVQGVGPREGRHRGGV